MDGTKRAERELRGRRFAVTIALPPRDVAVRVVAFDPLGGRTARTIAPVFGFAPAAAPRNVRDYEDPVLARRVRDLAAGFPGIAAIFVQDLRTGAGAAWNARARFPAASTVKLAIAIEVLRVLGERPPPGSSLDALLHAMLVYSDNAASNELLAWLGGSVEGGAAEVNETMEALGLEDSHLYGGFLAASSPRGPPIPLTVESEPELGIEKYTTAWDLAQLHRLVHLASAGLGPLTRLEGSLTPGDARFLLYTLAHSADHGKLDRYFTSGRVVVPHKAGWITQARHDAGLVYSPDGVFVASVMTWSESGVGESSDELAGRVARASLTRLRALRRPERAVPPLSLTL